MPARYRIYTDHSFVHTVAYGELRGAEMLAHARALVTDPSFSPSYSQLVDFRLADASHVDPEDIRSLATRNPFSRTARRVALVDSTYVYGMLRMYELLMNSDGDHTLVTRSEVDAWAFVQLSPDVVQLPAASAWDSGPAG